ncbi:sigma-54-dependent transcriptional regulator [Bacteroides rodentium]|uniref:sigma-54-dependent transcriptional regulator n=1 Tax=Bacteroides rodentium TaxID=691816 RepID=UPI000471999C|nr:sigma-54 dependent transcriptional regulator [Bacteroides rodentium]
MDKTRIIVVEDNIVYCEYVCNLLKREGYNTVQAYHLLTAKKHLQQATDDDIIVSDLRLPDGNGIDLLRWMRKEGNMQPFIIMTDYAEVHTAVESMKLGSLDYIPKKLIEDKLVPLIRSIQKERQSGHKRMPVFAREGSAFQKIMHRIKLVAATDMSVMIFGENGTGKEHIAHHLHEKSKRASKPFVAVDCGSLSRELAPSAFFGHVKGAFTGADSSKKGYFHEAEGGTLFLDEVGNLAMETQQMLLRAIQERRYRPVGDKSDRSFNVRIIAATNEDLEVAVSEKRFRQDLLYRLQDFVITVPPLRDCQEDIMPLAEFFREIANKELECNVSGFSSEARKALLTHPWPGNVRELRQKIMGAVLQTQEGMVTKEHLELAVTKPTSPVSFALRNDAEDKERILRALEQANGNRSLAAELLGISRSALYSKLEEYGLKYKFKRP